MIGLKCVKCQSDKVIPDVKIINQAGHMIRLGVGVYEKPDALVFKGTHSEGFHARVCGSCGHVELYINNPQDLYEVHRESRQAP